MRRIRIEIEPGKPFPLHELDFTEGRHQLYAEWVIVGKSAKLQITSLPVMGLEDQFARYSDITKEEEEHSG